MKFLALSMVVAGLVCVSGVFAEEVPMALRKNNCTPCHKADSKDLGPSWMAISQKYKGVTEYTYRGKAYPLKQGLAIKISKGGSGVWGEMPMIATPNISEADNKEILGYILGLAK